MLGKISIVDTYDLSEWKDLVAFIENTHGKNHVLTDRALFDWFYVRDDEKTDSASILTGYVDGELSSILGYYTSDFYIGNEFIKGAWMALWMTDPKYRNGIGALLMRRITEMFDVVAGQGASSMNEDIVRKMGFGFIDKIPKVVYIVNSELVDSFFYDIPVNENPIDIGSVGDIFPVEEFTREVYSPDWSNYSELAFSGLRDYDYINKRYFSYPFHKYEIFVSGSADKPLLLVYRKIKTSLGFLVGRIVEALIPSDCSQKDFDNFLIKTIRYFHGCAYIDFYCTSKKYIDLFRVSGFVLDENGSLPSLLDPVDLGRKYQNFEIWVSPNIRKQYPDIENDFFLSRGDGDQDRPNQSYWNEVNNL